MMMLRRTIAQILALLAACSLSVAAPRAVNESARQIAVAYDVDVLVVGGGSGAVSAAVATAVLESTNRK